MVRLFPPLGSFSSVLKTKYTPGALCYVGINTDKMF